MAKEIDVPRFLKRQGVFSGELAIWLEVFFDSNRDATNEKDIIEKQKATEQARAAEQKVRSLVSKLGGDPDKVMKEFRKELHGRPVKA